VIICSLNRDNNNSNRQEANVKQNENVEDDYFLRGAISNTSAGKQILEKNRT
jgi:hypothetical protein